MSKGLEQEIKRKLDDAVIMLLAATPQKDYASYLQAHARYLALQELANFTTERNEKLASGELKDDA